MRRLQKVRMPRGRLRERTRSNVPPARGVSSHRRRATTSTHSPLRRSLRLAQRLTAQQSSITTETSPMAQVGRRTSLRGHGATEIGVASSAHRQSSPQDARPGHHGHGERGSRRKHQRAISGSRASSHTTHGSQLTLGFDVQPPSTLIVGETIHPGLRIVVNAPLQSQAVLSEVIAAGHIIAVVSLIETSKDGALTSHGALAGTNFANSIQPVSMNTATSYVGPSSEAVGQTSFTDLAITVEGRYRLRVSLMQLMEPYENGSAGPATAPNHGYETVETADSVEFTVRTM